MYIEPATMDQHALAAARSERIDWRFKALPTSADGLTIAEFAATRPDLFNDGFHPAVLTLDGPAMDHNIATVHGWAAHNGLALAPHGKTTMAPELFARQIRAGAWGITAATFSQVRVYRAFGVSRIFLANQLVDDAALRWVAAECARDPRFEFYCWADSLAGVRLMDEALSGVEARLPVLVELGAAGGRTGTRTPAEAREVAAAIAAAEHLRLAGIGGYEGALAHDADQAGLSTVHNYLRGMRELAGELATGEQFIVSAGGSAYFDKVAENLGADQWPAGLGILPVLRSGAYITHDSGFYQEISPLGTHQRIAETAQLRPAMLLWAQVSSMPEPGLALLTAGKRDISFDEGLPHPEYVRRGGATLPLRGAEITKLNDQHAFCRIPADSDVRIGDWIGLGASHPCTVFDKWPLIPVVDSDGSTVTELIRTYF